MGFPGVKAVIFDLDDTLTVHQAAYDDSYLVIAMEIARRHDIDPTAAASSLPAVFLRDWETTPQSEFLRRIGIGGRDLLWGEAGTDRPELADISTWLNDFRVSSWNSVLRTHGICDRPLAARLAGQFPDEMWRRIGPFPEVRTVVRSLADRFKLGILTNGMPPHQHRKLAASGVADAFDPVITSGGIGVGKPDSKAFDAVLQALGVSASKALMVGDTLERDIDGAVAAGIHVVWIDRNTDAEAPDGLPYARVSSLTEILEML